MYIYGRLCQKAPTTAKKAKTMDAKRVIRENKKQAYRQKHGEEKIKVAVEKRAIKKDQKDFSKQLLNIGSIYDEEKKKEIKINKQEKVRERKKYEPGQALGAFKIVYYYDNLYYKMLKEFVDGETFTIRLIEIAVPNISLIKNLIENELRRQIASNNSKN